MSHVRGMVLRSKVVRETSVVVLFWGLPFELCVCRHFLFRVSCLGISYHIASLFIGPWFSEGIDSFFILLSFLVVHRCYSFRAVLRFQLVLC